jgi:hypothetical protein
MCRRDDVAGEKLLNHEMACSQRFCELISGQVLGSHRILNALRKLRVAFHAITSERKRSGMLLKLRRVMFAWQPSLEHSVYLARNIRWIPLIQNNLWHC